jgi:hypothetical protein
MFSSAERAARVLKRRSAEAEISRGPSALPVVDPSAFRRHFDEMPPIKIFGLIF